MCVCVWLAGWLRGTSSRTVKGDPMLGTRRVSYCGRCPRIKHIFKIRIYVQIKNSFLTIRVFSRLCFKAHVPPKTSCLKASSKTPPARHGTEKG